MVSILLGWLILHTVYHVGELKPYNPWFDHMPLIIKYLATATLIGSDYMY